MAAPEASTAEQGHSAESVHPTPDLPPVDGTADVPGVGGLLRCSRGGHLRLKPVPDAPVSLATKGMHTRARWCPGVSHIRTSFFSSDFTLLPTTHCTPVSSGQWTFSSSPRTTVRCAGVRITSFLPKTSIIASPMCTVPSRVFVPPFRGGGLCTLPTRPYGSSWWSGS